MAQTNFTPIQLYRTSTAAAVPTAGNLAAGELAINLTDERLYFKNAAGVVKLLASNTGALGTVTSVDGSGGTTGLTLTGGPITSSGTLTLGGTLGVANGGTGTATAFTAGSVVFAGASGVYSQDNANLFWDNSNDRLGIGTATPDVTLHVQSSTGQARVQNTTSGTALIGFRNSSTTDVPWVGTGGDDIRITTQSAERVRVTSSGTLRLVSAPTGNSLAFDTSGTERARIGIDASNGLGFAVGSTTPSVTITSAGDVGISTTAPAGKLDARGSVKIGPSGSGVFPAGTLLYLDDFVSGGTARNITWNLVTTNTDSAQISALREGASYATSLIFKTANPADAFSTERMRITSAGDVGIGTTAPSQKLQVSGSSASPITISINNDNPGLSAGSKLSFAYGGTETGYVLNRFDGVDFFSAYGAARGHLFFTGATERMRISADGNVGVGTVSPQLKFVVSNAGAAGLEIDPIAVASAPIIQSYNRSGAAYTQLTYSALHHVFQISGTEQMRISSAGNVGIGASTPTEKFQVQVNTGTSGFENGILLTNGVDANLFSYVTGTAATDKRALITVGAANQSLTFGTLYSERMRITATGDVGIGTTAPGAKLEVFNNGTSLRLNTSFVGGNAVDINPFILGVANDGYSVTVGGTIRQVIDGSGNVGIGTSSPTVYSGYTTLELDNASNGGILSIKKAGSVVGYINGASGMLMLAQSNDIKLTTTGSTTIQFSTNATERMRITSSGSVGIGTSTPNGKLTVAGSITAFTTGVTDQLLMEPLTAGSGSIILSVNDANNAYRDLTLNASVQIFKISNTERMRLDGSGNLLVGTTNSSTIAGPGIKSVPAANGANGPQLAIVTAASTGSTSSLSLYSTGAAAYRFYVDDGGTIYATSTTISAISDIRLKENVRELDAGLDTILALKPRRFDWKQGKGKDVRDDMGFIAQEVEEVLPQLIGGWKAGEGEPDDLKSVKAGDLIPVLVKAIQELTARVAQLEERK